jgi:hypothetical protein
LFEAVRFVANQAFQLQSRASEVFLPVELFVVVTVLERHVAPQATLHVLALDKEAFNVLDFRLSVFQLRIVDQQLLIVHFHACYVAKLKGLQVRRLLLTITFDNNEWALELVIAICSV